MYRSSLTLAFCVLYSAAGAASDLSSVYVAPGGIYAPSADVYVRPGPNPSALRGTRLRISAALLRGPRYRAPAAVYGDYGPPYAARRSMSTARTAYPERYYAESATPRRNTTMNMRRGRRCPCPTARERGHDATTAMAGGRTAIEARVTVTARMMGGAA
jgi:hypothetical protein